MAPIGALGLKAIWEWSGQILKYQPVIASVAASTAIFVLMTLSLFFSIRNHATEYYYHVIDDEMYQEFLWIREYIPSQYQIGISDTHEAWPFATITGKYAYTAEVAPRFHPKGRAVMEFLETGSKDTSWLFEEGITILYTSEAVENNDLIKVNNRTYLLVDQGD